jgi:hypothetical protein
MIIKFSEKAFGLCWKGRKTLQLLEKLEKDERRCGWLRN